MTATTAHAPSWRAADRWRSGSSSWLEALAEELAPRPGRLQRAVRLALLVAIGNGLMAAAHAGSLLGPVFLWIFGAAPRPMLVPREALRLVVAQAVLLSLAVPLAALLVEAPWFHLAFFGVFSAGWVYVLRRLDLSKAWLMTGIMVIDVFYAVIFDPRGFGWGAATSFGGAAIALGTILAFDGWLWPDPAEPALRASIASGLERAGQRLDLLRRAYFDADARDALPPAASASDLPSHITLLDRVVPEGASGREKALLLALVTIGERIHVEVARLTALAREPVAASLRGRLRSELDRVLEALAAEIAELEQRVRSGSGLSDPAPPERVEATRAALAALEAGAQSAELHRVPGADPAEVANLTAFVVGLRNAARVLAHRAPVPSLGQAAAAGTRSGQREPELVRWAVKVGLATVVALVVVLAAHHDEMDAAVWTVVVAGLPTYGALVRKMTLRIAGVLIGGASGILALTLVTPNFQTVLSYMLVCFGFFLVFGWIVQSSSRFAYAGSQMGTTFTITFAALAPSIHVTQPMWRFWAVIIGVVVTALVFSTLWPSYAGEAMLPRLRRLLRLTLDLIPERGEALGYADVRARLAESMRLITQLLGVADDARLEGARSGVDGDGVIHAAGSLRRIADRLAGVAVGRAQQRPLSAGAERARRRFQDHLAQRLDAWADYFAGGRPLDPQRAHAIAAAHDADGLEAAGAELDALVTAESSGEIEGWPLEARSSLLAELENYRRVAELASALDRQLAAIPAGGTPT